MATHVLDPWYLAITAIFTIAYQLAFFFVAWTLQFDKVTDFAGGTNFTLLAILTLSLSHVTHARNIVASVFVMVYGARLSAFLLFRILKTGKDERFNEMRSKFISFLGFWIFQMIWVWSCCLPITLLNSPKVQSYVQPKFGTSRDIIGVIMYAIGLMFESVSDIQKYSFRSRNGASRELFMNKGLFSISRHPNYFGDILLQFGIWVICLSPATDGDLGSSEYKALYASILGPFTVTFFLLFVSGIPLSERPTAKRRYEKNQDWEGYSRYLNRTSVIIPFPPVVYEKMPVFIKRTLFLEFPMYVFDPAKHSNTIPAGGDGHEGSREEEA